MWLFYCVYFSASGSIVIDFVRFWVIFSRIFVKSVYQINPNEVKNDYEVGKIINSTEPNTESIILDIGCGNGHHVSKLAEQNLNIIGIKKGWLQYEKKIIRKSKYH
jgi:tRNA G46 methylase TrmB